MASSTFKILLVSCQIYNWIIVIYSSFENIINRVELACVVWCGVTLNVITMNLVVCDTNTIFFNKDEMLKATIMVALVK